MFNLMINLIREGVGATHDQSNDLKWASRNINLMIGSGGKEAMWTQVSKHGLHLTIPFMIISRFSYHRPSKLHFTISLFLGSSILY